MFWGSSVPGAKSSSFLQGGGDAMRQAPILRTVLAELCGRLEDNFTKTAAAVLNAQNVYSWTKNVETVKHI